MWVGSDWSLYGKVGSKFSRKSLIIHRIKTCHMHKFNAKPVVWCTRFLETWLLYVYIKTRIRINTEKVMYKLYHRLVIKLVSATKCSHHWGAKNVNDMYNAVYRVSNVSGHVYINGIT